MSSIQREVNLKLINHEDMIEGENRSKLVDPNCSAYQWVEEIRKTLQQHSLVFKFRLPMCVEIVKASDEVSKEEKLNRAKCLHDINIKKQIYLHFDKKSLVVRTGSVQGYGYTNIFVGWFQEKLTLDNLALFRRLIFDIPYNAEELQAFLEKQTEKLVFNTKPLEHNDWMCPVCNFLIHGRKPKCLKCNSLRPSNENV